MHEEGINTKQTSWAKLCQAQFQLRLGERASKEFSLYATKPANLASLFTILSWQCSRCMVGLCQQAIQLSWLCGGAAYPVGAAAYAVGEAAYIFGAAAYIGNCVHLDLTSPN